MIYENRFERLIALGWMILILFEIYLIKHKFIYLSIYNKVFLIILIIYPFFKLCVILFCLMWLIINPYAFQGLLF